MVVNHYNYMQLMICYSFIYGIYKGAYRLLIYLMHAMSCAVGRSKEDTHDDVKSMIRSALDELDAYLETDMLLTF